MNMDDLKLQLAAIFSPGLFPSPGTLHRQEHIPQMLPKSIAGPLELANWQQSCTWGVHFV